MNRRERLLATIRGESVDRPPVSFYELNGLDEDPHDPDPYNIYNHNTWLPLIELTREKTDRIVMRNVPYHLSYDPLQELSRIDIRTDPDGQSFTRTTIPSGKHTLTSLTRRDLDVNTTWTVEHLLKNIDDINAFLELPIPSTTGILDLTGVLETEAILGDTGIVMIDTPDPLCEAAQLFNMDVYTIIALTEPALFHQLLDHFAAILFSKTEAVAKELPGRLWRLYGPEYASPPYLPPHLFWEYVVAYDRVMVDMIQEYGGFARVHCHGKIKRILDGIIETGCIGLDPIEPPPQGDVELSFVRENYGEKLVLFGNLEASDIENLPTRQFHQKVHQALDQGTFGQGRGFVLLPSACPYGRILSPLALANYECMIEAIENF